MIEIDRDVPLPAIRRGRPKLLYPWAQMEIGDSFWAPKRSVICIATARRKRHGEEYTTRREDHDGVRGFRVWRIK